MSARWYIHQNGRKMGPMTSFEVRESLREGSVDPMDLVSRVGSAVKVELYEVDEIFISAPESENVTQEDSAVLEASGGESRRRTEVASAKRRDKHNDRRKLKSARSQGRREPKKFYLYDRKKRKLGPLSAREIQSIFYRGIVDHKAKVVKTGSQKSVPVAMFARVYAGARSQRYETETLVGARGAQAVTRTAVSMGSSRVLDEMARLRRLGQQGPRLSSIILPILGVVGLIALGYITIERYMGIDERASQPRISETSKRDDSEKMDPGRRKKNTRQGFRGQKTAPDPAAKDRRPGRRRSAVLPRRPVPTPRKPAVRVPQKPRSRPPSRAPSGRQVATKPQSRPTYSAPKPQSRQTSAGRGPVAALRSQIGQIGSARDMRFSKSALGACSMRCTLNFTDSRGESLRVVFFKGAFEAKLARSPGRVTIRGRITGSPSSLMMILQGVN